MGADEQIFGVVEAARILGLHPNSLRRAEREGRVPAARREPLSRHRYYTAGDVEALAQALRRRGSGWPP
jgi:DNA-binding transcriptional MerR regulator